MFVCMSVYMSFFCTLLSLRFVKIDKSSRNFNMVYKLHSMNFRLKIAVVLCIIFALQGHLKKLIYHRLLCVKTSDNNEKKYNN